MKWQILAIGKWAQRVLETCTRSHSGELKEFELEPMGSDPFLGEALASLFLTGSMRKACRAVVSTMAAH